MSFNHELIYNNPTSLSHLAQSAQIYGYNNGLLMFDKDSKPFLCPFTLLPRQTHHAVFQRMWNSHHIMQELYCKVANDHDFLLQHLSSMAKEDPFIAMLVDTLLQNRDCLDPACLVSRSDYMIHEQSYDPNTITDDAIVIGETQYTPQQVEFNAISTGFSSLSHRVQSMHNYLINSQIKGKMAPGTFASPRGHKGIFPPHDGPDGPAKTLHRATEYMSEKFPQFLNQFNVLMVIQPGESNVADQRLIEYALLENHNIPTIRASLLDIHQNIIYNNDKDSNLPPMYNIKADDGSIISSVPISVVYYRSCYTPRDFGMDNDFTAPKTVSPTAYGTNPHIYTPETQKLISVYQALERSNVVKCPNIGLHLAGTKKIQQVLTDPTVLFSFLGDAIKVAAVHMLFTDIYGLQLTDRMGTSAPIIQLAIDRPDLFVLKPMREGGGNNYYHDELKQLLLQYKDVTDPNEHNPLDAMILMSKICPNIDIPQIMLRRDADPVIVKSISEYGVLGGFFATVTENKSIHIVHNEPFGVLVRAKAHNVTEGGVAAGYSCISSVILE